MVSFWKWEMSEEVFEQSEEEVGIMQANDDEEFIPVEGGEKAPMTPQAAPSGKYAGKSLVDEMAEIVYEDEEEMEEGRAGKFLRPPPKVSQKERDEHNCTHCPFRLWCKYCVRARAHKMAHAKLKGEDEELKVPRISMDYFYMSDKDEKAKRKSSVSCNQ